MCLFIGAGTRHYEWKEENDDDDNGYTDVPSRRRPSHGSGTGGGGGYRLVGTYYSLYFVRS